MKKRIWILSLASVLFLSCDNAQEYLKHDLKYEKAGDCRDLDSRINVVANTVGERFTYQECLSADYNGDYTVERKGDTVLVQLKKASGGQRSLYNITLDINTRPVYHFLSLNGSVFPVTVKRY